MTPKLIKVALLATTAFWLSGCITTGEKTVSEEDIEVQETGLDASNKFRFDDLPVPAGFRLIEDKSFVFQNNATRVALLKYAGRAKTEELISFYERKMLLYNWHLLNVVQYGKSVLNFERGNQSCIVTIEPKTGKRIITISLSPKGSKVKGPEQKSK